MEFRTNYLDGLIRTNYLDGLRSNYD